MGAGASLPEDHHIVIIGGGYGGTTAARALKKNGAKFTLISNRTAMYHNIASPRALTEEAFHKKCLIPLDKVFGDNFKLGKVTGVHPKTKEVSLESGEKIGYSSLIIATGKSGSFPYAWQGADDADALKRMETMRKNIETANRILVIGGGATGIEQAAEIAAKFPTKEVTVLHGRDLLVQGGLSDNFYKRLNEILAKLKIKVITGEKVEDLEGIDNENVGAKTVTTNKGTGIEVDYVIKAIGLYVDPSAYKEGLESAVTMTGQLTTGDFLEVEGFEDVYALGDCNTRYPQLAYAASEQAELLVKNLICKHNGKSQTAWKDDSLPIKIIMSVGPNEGLGQFPGGRMLPEFVARGFKSKDLMVGIQWKKYNLPVPS